jgi:hypothetical protein
MKKSEFLTTVVHYDEQDNFLKKMYKHYDDFLVYSFSRNAISLFQKDVDARNACVYFIFSTVNNVIYIGKSENGVERIFSHNNTKDFWNRGMLFTHLKWGPTEIAYFEYHFYTYFKEEEIEVVNLQPVYKPVIDPIMESSLNVFIKQILFYFKLESSDIFREHKLGNKLDVNIVDDASFVFNLDTSEYKNYQVAFCKYVEANDLYYFSSSDIDKILKRKSSDNYLDALPGCTSSINYGYTLYSNINKFSVYAFFKKDVDKFIQLIEQNLDYLTADNSATGYRLSSSSIRFDYVNLSFNNVEDSYVFIYDELKLLIDKINNLKG